MPKNTKTKKSISPKGEAKSKHDGTAKNEAGLTDMQEAFCHEYCVDMNATQAAIRAKYSEHTAEQLGYQLLQIPSVRTRIQELLKQKFSRIDLTAERILLELFRLATVDLEGAYDDAGNLLPIKQMPEDLRRAVAGVESEEIYEGHGQDRTWTGYKKKLKLFDKTRALEMLAKHFKLLTEVHEHKITDLAKRLAAARDRRK